MAKFETILQDDGSYLLKLNVENLYVYAFGDSFRFANRVNDRSYFWIKRVGFRKFTIQNTKTG